MALEQTRQAYSWRLLARLLLCAVLLPVVAPAPSFPEAKLPEGVVVESVEAGSPGAGAGVMVGDTWLTWERPAAPPATPDKASGTLASPFDWMRVAMDEAPRAPVKIRGTRAGSSIKLELPAARPGVRVRPALSADALKTYTEAMAAVDRAEPERAASLLQALASAAGTEKSWLQSAWFHFRTFEVLAAGGQLDKAVDTPFKSCTTTLQVARDQTDVAFLWDAAGKAYERAGKTQGERGAYEAALAIRRQYAHNSLSEARSLADLADVARRRSDLATAEELHKQALAIREARAPGGTEVAASLNGLGIVATKRGNLKDADDLFKRALAIWKVRSPGSLDVAATLSNLGVVASSRGDLSAAAAYLNESLAIRERLAPDSADVAKSLTALGTLAFRSRDLDKAEGYYRRAAAIDEKVVPGSFDHGGILGNLGMIALTRGDLNTAEERYRSALAIAEKLSPGGPEAAVAVYNLAIIAGKRGDLDTAEAMYTRALTIQEKLAPVSAPVAVALNGLGSVALDRGDLAAAEGFFRRAVAVHEKVSPSSVDTAQGYYNIGNVTLQRGDLAQAEEYYSRAREALEKIAPGSLEVADVLNNLGYLASLRGDLAGAEDWHRKSLAIREKIAPDSLDVAASLNNLGAVAVLAGDHAKAEQLDRRALAIREKIAPGSVDMALSLNNLGLDAIARDDLPAAEELLGKALRIREEKSPGSLDVASTLGGVAEVQRHRDRNADAEATLAKALVIIDRLAPGSAAQAEALHTLGTLALAAGRNDQAAGYLTRAIQALESQVGRLGGSEETRTGYRSRYRSYYTDLVDVQIRLGKPAEAFQVLERSRARGLLEMLAQRDLTFGKDVPPHLDRERKRLAIEYDKTQEALGKVNKATEADPLLTHLREVRDAHAKVVEKIRASSPGFAALQFPVPLDLEAARRSLDPGTVMLSYSVGKERTHLFVLTPEQGLTEHTIAIGEASLREAVEKLRVAIRHAEGGSLDKDEIVTSGKALYTELVKPAEASIASGKRLLILPDGPLHLLPFSALVRPTGSDKSTGATRRDWQYLVEWRGLHTAVSATVAAELAKRRGGPPAATGQSLVAFGDPVYPSLKADAQDATRGSGNPTWRAVLARGFQLPPLPATRREVEEISKPYGETAGTYLAEAATEERAKSACQKARYIHFACHGLLDETFPLDSGLALSIPERPGAGQENGILQAWEVLEGVRTDAELVVLSACNTALGKDMGGEGLIGLTRAFEYAGARSVLSSVWSVEDASTAELMRRFYGYLKAGKTKDEALRQAQVDLIRAPIEVTGESGAPEKMDASHPFFWAAFVLDGDWK